MSDPDPRADIPEALYWDIEARAMRRTGLAEVRSTAAKWEASIATILGVFATVAIIKGPETLADVGSLVGRILIALAVLIAVALAIIATYRAAKAAQGTPRSFEVLTGPALREWYQQQGPKAVNDLRWSRWLALGAAGAVLLAMSLSWLMVEAADNESDAVNVVVVLADGSTVCGELTFDADRLAVAASPSPVPLVGVADIDPVAKCPARP